MCLAFPKTGCSLGVNQRDTHRSEQPCYACMSVYMGFSSLCMCAHLYLCGNRVRFVMFLYHGLQYLSREILKTISSGLIHHANPVPCGACSSNTKCGQAFTVKQHLCVSFCCGMGGFADGAVADTPSHTVLSLFCYLLINQNQVSL